MSPVSEELLDRARRWREHDPDPVTRAELTALIDARSEDLAHRFRGPLRFGTAGLRGRIGAGESLMNVATVCQASRGLGEWLLARMGSPRVVIGCDARHRSADFQQAAASVLAAMGCEVLLLPARLPTPLTAFSVRHLHCDAGIMVTASHNPPQDNGYKVYLGGRSVADDAARGVQFIGPGDEEIARCIAAAGPACDIPRATEGIAPLDREVLTAYCSRAASLVPHTASSLPIVVTAMHGVGGAVLVSVLREAGFTEVIPVAEQYQPDPDFPTVAFPNPEEEGALDLAIATARQHGAQLILALDPDADRCSVALPEDPARPEGAWRQLTGDRVGAFLGEDAARRSGSPGGVLACSVVSSRLLGRIAERHGMKWVPTLTGFKWIGRTVDLRFGYEEALGYCTDPQAVRDKDGITACLRVADLARRTGGAAGLYRWGEDIDAAYSAYRTRPVTVRCDDASQVPPLLARLLADPPQELAGSPVIKLLDLSSGAGDLPPTPGLLMRTEADDQVVIRPSGTEPKLKCYVEAVATTGEDAERRVDAVARHVATVVE